MSERRQGKKEQTTFRRKKQGTSEITNRTAEKPESYAEKYGERADSSKLAFSPARAGKGAIASYMGGHTD